MAKTSKEILQELDELVDLDSSDLERQMEQWSNNVVKVGDAWANAKRREMLAELARKVGEARLYFDVREELESDPDVKITEELLKKRVLLHERYSELYTAEADAATLANKLYVRYEALKGKSRSMETLSYMHGASGSPPTVDVEAREAKKAKIRKVTKK